MFDGWGHLGLGPGWCHLVLLLLLKVVEVGRSVFLLALSSCVMPCQSHTTFIHRVEQLNAKEITKVLSRKIYLSHFQKLIFTLFNKFSKGIILVLNLILLNLHTFTQKQNTYIYCSSKNNLKFRIFYFNQLTYHCV